MSSQSLEWDSNSTTVDR